MLVRRSRDEKETMPMLEQVVQRRGMIHMITRLAILYYYQHAVDINPSIV